MRIYYLNGKKYITQNSMHKDGIARLKLMPLDESKYNKLINDIIKNTKAAINPEEVLRAALEQMTYDRLLNIRKLVQKKKVKVLGKKGCYELIIQGKNDFEFIPIVGGI